MAVAVVEAAVEAGLAGAEIDDPIAAVQSAMWQPEYPQIES